MWFIAMNGIFVARDKALAKVAPTMTPPINPGPQVAAIASKSDSFNFASDIALSTTVSIFSR